MPTASKKPEEGSAESGDEEYEVSTEDESNDDMSSGEDESDQDTQKRKRAAGKGPAADAAPEKDEMDEVQNRIKRVREVSAREHFFQLGRQCIMRYLEITGDHIPFKSTGQIPDILKCFSGEGFTDIESEIKTMLIACRNNKLLDLWALFFFVHSVFCMSWKTYFSDADATGINGLPLGSSIGGFGRNAAMALYVEIWELLDQVECLFSGVSASFRMAEAARLANMKSGFRVDGHTSWLLNCEFSLRKSMMSRGAEAAFRSSEENVEFHGRSVRAAYRMSGHMQESQEIMESLRDPLTLVAINGNLPEAIAILGEIHDEFVLAQLSGRSLFDIAKKEARRLSKSKPKNKASLERLMDDVLDALKEVMGYALDSVSGISAIMLCRDANGSLHVPTALDATDLSVSMQQAVSEAAKNGVSVEQQLQVIKSLLSARGAMFGTSQKVGAFAGRVFSVPTLDKHILSGDGALANAMAYNILEKQQRDQAKHLYPFAGVKEERKRMFMRQNVASWPNDFFSADGVGRLEKTYRDIYLPRLPAMADASEEARKGIIREMKLKSLTRSGAFVLPMYTAVQTNGNEIISAYASPVEYLQAVRLSLDFGRPPPGIVNKMTVVKAFVDSIDMLPPLPIVSDDLEKQLHARNLFAQAKDKVLKAMRRRVTVAVNLEGGAASDEEEEEEEGGDSEIENDDEEDDEEEE